MSLGVALQDIGNVWNLEVPSTRTRIEVIVTGGKGARIFRGYLIKSCLAMFQDPTSILTDNVSHFFSNAVMDVFVKVVTSKQRLRLLTILCSLLAGRRLSSYSSLHPIEHTKLQRLNSLYYIRQLYSVMMTPFKKGFCIWRTVKREDRHP